LTLAAKPQADISGKLNDIVIRTMSNNRIAPILDSIIQGFQNGDLLTAWYEGCAAADAVHEDIIAGNLPPDACQCSGEASLSTLHPCSGCLVLCLCSQLELADDGARICEKCSKKRQPGAAELKTAADKEAWFLNWVKRRLLDALRREIAIKGLKRTDPSLTALKDGRLTLNKYWHSSSQEWVNAYTQQPTNIQRMIDEYSTRTANYKRNAFGPSLDAVFPFAEFNKSYWTHCHTNIVLISLAMQFAKYTYIPAVLAHLGHYLRNEITLDQVMDRMNQVHEVGLQSAFAKSLRLQKDFNETKFTALQREWLAGRPLTSQVVASQKWYEDPKGAFKGWKPSCYERFIKIVRQMEKKSTKTFPTSQNDDAPYPFHASSIPKGKLPIITKLILTDHFERLDLANGMESFRRAS
jgi:hypothetical protein